MLKFKFGKLVRDKIVDHQIASGGRPTYHTLNTEQHKQELVNKIIEEAQEITRASADEVTAEIADVQQAIDDLKGLYHVNNTDVAEAQVVKNEKNGDFKKCLFVDYVEVDENDKWVAYYRKNADRYPEIK